MLSDLTEPKWSRTPALGFCLCRKLPYNGGGGEGRLEAHVVSACERASESCRQLESQQEAKSKRHHSWLRIRWH